MAEEEKEERGKGGQMIAWAKAFTIIVGALIAIYGAFFKGEPGAALSYKELAKSFNELRAEFAKQQAFVDGFLSGLKQTPAPVAVAAPAPAPKCAAPTKHFAPAPPAPVSKPAPLAPRLQMEQRLPKAMPPQLEDLQKQEK